MNEKKYQQHIIKEDPFKYYSLIFALKNLYRQGWLVSGISKERCESVAEHSFAVAMLCLQYAPAYPVEMDFDRLIKMALIHDCAESLIGDIIPSENISSDSKYTIELEAIKQFMSTIPDSEEWIDLWIEFEKGESNESIFIKQMDKLEMLLQASIYEHLESVDLTSFFENTSTLFQDDFFINIYKQFLEKKAGH